MSQVFSIASLPRIRIWLSSFSVCLLTFQSLIKILPKLHMTTQIQLAILRNATDIYRKRNWKSKYSFTKRDQLLSTNIKIYFYFLPREHLLALERVLLELDGNLLENGLEMETCMEHGLGPVVGSRSYTWQAVRTSLSRDLWHFTVIDQNIKSCLMCTCMPNKFENIPNAVFLVIMHCWIELML